MSKAKEKVEAIASNERVQNAKSSLLKFISDARVWVVSNWTASGWRGKAKVAAALIVAFFFCRGVFCGWGSSSKTISSSNVATSGSNNDSVATSDSNNADAAALLFMLGAAAAGNGGAQQDSISIWTCRNCGRQIQSKSIPSGTIRCQSGAGRFCFFNKSN